MNGKRNGKGKEYNSYHQIIYDGEYLNGERNGKGIEYNVYGYQIFNGEFLNGKRWNGNGKIYYKNKLIFKIEYINGKMWNGKSYNNKKYKLKEGKVYFVEYNKRIKFEGEYLNGERNGKGKEYDYGSFSEDLIFEGEYLNGKRNGKGKEYKKEILIFEGEYLNGKKWNGKAKNYDTENLDENKFELKNGKGFMREYYSFEKEDFSVIEFEGEYFNGLRNGKGKEYTRGFVDIENLKVNM